MAGASGEGDFWVAAPSVRDVNPIGAGDSFTAGLAAALERGEDLRAADRRRGGHRQRLGRPPLAGGVDAQLVAELLDVLAPEPA